MFGSVREICGFGNDAYFYRALTLWYCVNYMNIPSTIKKTPKTLAALIRSHKKVSIAIAAVIVIIMIIALAGSQKSSAETMVVEKRDVVDVVKIAGRVEADIVADLGFETSGTIRDVSVATNDVVKKGDRLASLDLGTLGAELASAQASVAIKRAQLNNMKLSLNAVSDKQDTLVDAAHRKMLSEGLVAEPESNSYTQTPPVITGRYDGAEGYYKIIIDRGIQQDSTIRTFGIEKTEEIKIAKTSATRLGTRGLYIAFPDEITAYNNTTWYVYIPNTKSQTYVSNYNAYQEALSERDRVLDEAEGDLRSQQVGVSIAESELAQSVAEVSRIQALIGQRILRAPFDGVVTAVQVDPGESVTGGAAAISVISKGVLGVEVDLPEIDSVKVMTGDTATVSLDAFGESESFLGTVVSVNRSETVVDGVSVYEARVAFDEQDARIVSGMTADVSIETERKDAVVAIPARAIKYHEDGTPYVLISAGDKKKPQERTVALGVRGSDSYVQILAGVSEGEVVVIAASK